MTKEEVWGEHITVDSGRNPNGRSILLVENLFLLSLNRPPGTVRNNLSCGSPDAYVAPHHRHPTHDTGHTTGASKLSASCSEEVGKASQGGLHVVVAD
jgi:hypothetical protein